MFRLKIKCSILFMLLCIFAIISENTASFLLHIGALILHEGAHYLMACMLGCDICQIKLLPYGCSMEIRNMDSPWDELMIALCGPVCSFICFLGCRFISNALEFAEANMYIALINLLPVFPLDGGRALNALLVMLGITPSKIFRVLINFALSIVIGVCGCIIQNITLIIFSVFLFTEGISAMFDRGSTVLAYMKNVRCAVSGRGVRVHPIAFHKDVSLGSALSYGQGRYSIIYILDDNLKEIAMADSITITEIAAKYGSSTHLGDIIPFIDRGKY